MLVFRSKQPSSFDYLIDPVLNSLLKEGMLGILILGFRLLSQRQFSLEFLYVGGAIVSVEELAHTGASHELEEVLDELWHFTGEIYLSEFFEANLFAFENFMLTCVDQAQTSTGPQVFHLALSNTGESRIRVGEKALSRSKQHRRLLNHFKVVPEDGLHRIGR